MTSRRPRRGDGMRIDGRSLTIEKIARFSSRATPVVLDAQVDRRVAAGCALVAAIVRSTKTVYGINTGFGALSTVRIPAARLAVIQRNLLRSHNTGVGEPVPPEITRIAMLLRLNTLVQGHSGVTPQTVHLLLKMINAGVVPIIPSKGSVGASGDLAPLAALALPLIGEGEVFFRGRHMSARRALRALAVKPLKLRPKEGLALINGTQLMTAYAVKILIEAEGLADLFDLAGAASLEALRGTDRAFDHRLSDLRPYAGQRRSAANLVRFLKGSKIVRSHRQCNKVQDAYSLRCIPQVHGAVRDLLSFVKQQIEIEINAVTDNPVLFPQTDDVILGGNFHGEPVAFALDILAIGLAELASISERRVFRLLDPALSGLEPFLVKKSGINSGMMMLQTTAAALVAQNKILAHPASIDSIPTSANQEDHVSMGANGALKAYEILQNTKQVLAIELICSAQGIDILQPLKSSPSIRRAKSVIRRAVGYLRTDRNLKPDIENTVRLIDSGRLLKAIRRSP